MMMVVESELTTIKMNKDRNLIGMSKTEKANVGTRGDVVLGKENMEKEERGW